MKLFKRYVGFDIIAHELDPTKQYIIEVKEGDMDIDDIIKLVNYIGKQSIAVITKTGEVLKIVPKPETLSARKKGKK